MINKSCLTEMVNFGFLLFSMVNIFAINTHKTLKLFVLGNIETEF